MSFQYKYKMSDSKISVTTKQVNDFILTYDKGKQIFTFSGRNLDIFMLG